MSNKNLSNMMCLDVFLSSLKQEEYKSTQEQIRPLKGRLHSLLAFDVISPYLLESFHTTQKYTDLQALLLYHKKSNWKIDFQELLTKEYNALVLTNNEKKIIWANKGFTKMTGYPMKYAIGKKPTFLQGKDTSAETLYKIKQNLSLGIAFTETLVNYSKENIPYNCHISITPLRNQQDEITHFIALEKKLP